MEELTPLPKLPDPDERHSLRLRVGITRRDAARKLGVSDRTLERWEEGRGPGLKNHRRYYEQLAGWRRLLEAHQEESAWD